MSFSPNAEYIANNFGRTQDITNKYSSEESLYRMENLICTQFFDNLKSKRDTLDYIDGKEHEKSRSLGRL